MYALLLVHEYFISRSFVTMPEVKKEGSKNIKIERVDFITQLASYCLILRGRLSCPLQKSAKTISIGLYAHKTSFIIRYILLVTCLEKITCMKWSAFFLLDWQIHSDFNYLSPESFPTTLLLPVYNLCRKSNKQLNYSKNFSPRHYKVCIFCHMEVVTS